MEKLRVLFVDDEPNVLVGLQRMLRGMRNEWEMDFAEGGQQALEILESKKFEVVVTDMRMPGMSGADLLGEVMRRQPDTVRIVLSGHSDEEMILKTVVSTHRFLSKPCSADELKNVVLQAMTLRKLLDNERLKSLVSRVESLPSLPALYLEIVEELRSPDPSIKKVGEIVEKDVGMTGKLLQLVNSAFFGLPRRVSNPAQAASLLGVETLKSLVLSVKVFSQFDEGKLRQMKLESLWNHSLSTGHCARLIARSEKADSTIRDEGFLAGLLHDIGKLIFAVNLGEEYGAILGRSRQEKRPLRDLEIEAFGSSHEDIGAYLLGLWGLSDSILEAVAFHDNPRSSPERSFSPLASVHFANALVHSRGGDDGSGLAPLDAVYLEELGLTERLPAWKECLEVGANSGD